MYAPPLPIDAPEEGSAAAGAAAGAAAAAAVAAAAAAGAAAAAAAAGGNSWSDGQRWEAKLTATDSELSELPTPSLGSSSPLPTPPQSGAAWPLIVLPPVATGSPHRALLAAGSRRATASPEPTDTDGWTEGLSAERPHWHSSDADTDGMRPASSGGQGLARSSSPRRVRQCLVM